MTNFFLYLMAAVYTLAGLNHFRSPRFYVYMMPPFIPLPKLMVDLSGLAEIVLGIGLFFPVTRVWAAWGVIALLIAVFPANVFMAVSDKFAHFPAWLLWGRLPLQGVLIWWAYQYTK